MSWHVNPETGEPGRCSALVNCPFGSLLDGHARTKKDAAKIYENFREGLLDPKGVSHFYFVSDEDHERFTQGECGDLAAELHRLTGYPVVALGSRQLYGETLWDHIALRAPDGRILDVTGIQPQSETIKAWRYDAQTFRIEDISVGQINHFLGMGEKPVGSQAAATVAAQILERLQE